MKTFNNKSIEYWIELSRNILERLGFRRPEDFELWEPDIYDDAVVLRWHSGHTGFTTYKMSIRKSSIMVYSSNGYGEYYCVYTIPLNELDDMISLLTYIKNENI